MSGDERPVTTGFDGAWKTWAPAIGLCALVVGVFVIAAALQAERSSPTLDDSPSAAGIHGVQVAPPPPPAPTTATELPRSSPASPLPEPTPERPEPVPDAAASIDWLAGRDLARAARHVGEWTVQILVACDPANVRRAVERLGGGDDVFVLPAALNARPCWRVCRGRFADRAEAEHALPRELPASERAVPRAFADLVP